MGNDLLSEVTRRRPSRTIALLAADLGGRQARRSGDADERAAIMSLFVELLEDIVDNHNGVCRRRGWTDGALAVFARPSDALAAAVDTQAAVVAQMWLGEVPVQARLALHIGVPEAGDDPDHFEGQLVERCRHLRAIAQSGQTLLSAAAHDFLFDRLPPEMEAVDLGLRRLPDLQSPEHVFGLVCRDTMSSGLALSCLGTWPNNLPQQRTSFVGRARELEEVHDALTRSRVVVLTGTGGCGKTRLALQAAAGGSDLAPQGAWFVELAPVTDEELVSSALAGAVGARPAPGSSPLQAAINRLALDCALVVLDNCEHVVNEAAHVCEALLRGCPQVVVLVTSRVPFGLADELDWHVPSLSLTTGARGEVRLGPSSDAVRLFVERAVAARPNFAPGLAEQALIAQICQHLDGIPLAIELAAARARALSLDEIAAGLVNRFSLLTAGPVGKPARQQTLRASVEWSYELLTNQEQRLFRRLSVFAGGCSLSAAERICSDEGAGPFDALDTLTSLVDKSLVVADERHGTVRYRMLETVHEYAREVLTSSGEMGALQERHLKFLLEFAEGGEPHFLTPERPKWTVLFDADAENLAAALHRATEVAPERALALCAALTWWWLGGRVVAGERACAAALAASSPSSSSLRAKVTWARALMARNAGEYGASATYAREAMAIAEAAQEPVTVARSVWALSTLKLQPDPVGSRQGLERAITVAADLRDDWLVVHATSSLAYSYLFTDDVHQAERLFIGALPLAELIGPESLSWYYCGLTWSAAVQVEAERCFEFGQKAVAAAVEIGDPVTEAVANWFMAAVECAQGRHQDALARLERSEARARACGAGWVLPQTRVGIAGALAALGYHRRAYEILSEVVAGGADGSYNLALAMAALANQLRLQGDPAEAAALARRALEIVDRTGSRSIGSSAREVLGRLAASRGDWADAGRLLHAALAERAEAHLRLGLPQTLDALAEVAAGLGSAEDAARLLGAADGARRALGLVRSPPDEPDAAALQERLRHVMGAKAYSSAHTQGAAMTLEEAVTWARRARGTRKRPPSGWASLTPTESQVVDLVRQGLTNPQMAERLFISPATVKIHLKHIFTKLAVHTRAELAARAEQRHPG